MASAAEQLASNLSLSSFGKAEELKKRIWFALGALIVYRLCTYIPLPGIDPVALRNMFADLGGNFLDVVNTFSGGALQRMSIVTLGIIPYISASIIMQLLTTMNSTLAQWKKEGEQGRKKINQMTRYGTVALTIVQGWGVATGLQGQAGVVIDPGLFFVLTTVITLVGGTMFLMWLGEQITQRGIGNGISLIIFAGIVAELPGTLAQAFTLSRNGQLDVAVLLAMLIGAAALIWFIVFFERAQRRVVIQYPKRQQGNRVHQGDKSHLPLKLNVAGVIPPIFASSLLLMPLTVAGMYQTGGPEWITTVTALLGPGKPVYIALYIALIVFFCFFYTAIQFNPEETADNLKKHGGFVPGIRPGKRTAEYLDYVLTRLTVIGSAYIATVCAIPEFLIGQANVPFYLGGTSLLIVVNVTMDTVSQIQSHLMAQQYESLLKKSRLKGGRR
ncbi:MULTISPECIES: preprotein translocase subunit SecY [Kordiimonas]|uniref:preprotein translocase subunit SecY n=1 Tax=Kordiimonas TaxID=288021 RepID=UPI001FF42134|nr:MULTISPECIES: preprotein translocase subunit SecY [Kordiimonas]MCK0069502.1 preprotein translocase subunit SecY [Kordiimonas laminariae]UTW56969.1 preprotein translocase subunit SecY [Kordiimonas sp. SCSIO 12603]